MADLKHIIEPERMGLWVAATFVLALLALVTAIGVAWDIENTAYVTQAEVLILNKKIENVAAAVHVPTLKRADDAKAKAEAK